MCSDVCVKKNPENTTKTRQNKERKHMETIERKNKEREKRRKMIGQLTVSLYYT